MNNIKNGVNSARPDHDLEDHYTHFSNWQKVVIRHVCYGMISMSGLTVGLVAADIEIKYIALTSIIWFVVGALSVAIDVYMLTYASANIQNRANRSRTIPKTKLNTFTGTTIKRKVQLKGNGWKYLAEGQTALLTLIQPILIPVASFAVGSTLPFLIIVEATFSKRPYLLYGVITALLIILSVLIARIERRGMSTAIFGIAVMGTLTIAFSALIGFLLR